MQQGVIKSISILYSSIKSLFGKGKAPRGFGFQFYIVRLKEHSLKAICAYLLFQFYIVRLKGILIGLASFDLSNFNSI